MTEINATTNRIAATPIKQEVNNQIENNEPKVKADSIRNDDYLPLISYRKEKNRPYSVDYFKLINWYDLNRNSEFDTEGLLKDVETVESYINNKIINKKLLPDTETFDFLIKNILETIGDLPTELGEAKIKRVATYIKKKKELDVKYKEFNKIKEQLNATISK